MMVMGIMAKPTATRVAAPVSRLASGERTGRAEEEELVRTRAVGDAVRGRSLLFAMLLRVVLRAEK